MVDRRSRTPTQAMSKRAFNSEHRLTLARALLRRAGSLFDKKAIEHDTGVPGTTVYNELNALVELRVLSVVADGSRNLFSVVEGPFWAWCADLLETADREDAVETTS